jgi:hypothetical protein
MNGMCDFTFFFCLFVWKIDERCHIVSYDSEKGMIGKYSVEISL